MSEFSGTITLDGVDYSFAGTADVPQSPTPPPPASGAELDYVENSSGVINVTTHTNGDNNGQAWIQGNPVILDGSTRICIEVFCAAVEPDFHQSILFDIYEQLPGSNKDLGMLIDCGTGGQSGDVTRSCFTAYGKRYLTPSAGTHTYQIRLWSTGGSLNRVYCGFGSGPDPGDPPNFLPAFYRISTA